VIGCRLALQQGEFVHERLDHRPAVISGSLVGALSSAVGTSIVQKHQDRRDLVAKMIVRREALYSDFIAERAAAG
jgi:hypothetical protein